MPPMDLYTRGSHDVRRPRAPQSSINTEITGNKSSGNGKMFNAQTTFIEHYHESEDLSETRRTIGASASHRQKTTMSRLLSCGDNNAPPLIRVDEEERHVMHRTTNFSHDVPHMESIEKLHAFGIKVEAEYGNLSNEWINWSKVQTKRTGRRRGNAQRIKISESIRMDIDAKRQDFLSHQRQLISILHDDKHPICRVMDTIFGSIYDALKSRLNILEEAIALLTSHQSTSPTAEEIKGAATVENFGNKIRNLLGTDELSIPTDEDITSSEPLGTDTQTQGDIARHNSFEDLCRSLFDLGNSPTSKHLSVDKRMLLLEGRASAGLYQCLCRACPVETHESCGHTAHLRLRRQGPNNDLDGNYPENIMTEFHMAIKSTMRQSESFIWLKVISSATCELNKGLMPKLSPNTMGIPRSGSPATSPSQQSGKLPTSRKRKAESESPVFSTPNKSTKTAHGQTASRVTTISTEVVTDGLLAGEVRFCPEYLAQHDHDNIVVMKMVDRQGEPHKVYYLPPYLRPNEDGPIQWPVVLLHWRFHLDMPWVIYVARRISEATLRFDRFSASSVSKPWTVRDVLVFYIVETGAPSPLMLEPFLEVRMEGEMTGNISSPGWQGRSNERARYGRRAVLVNLGLMFLQLGLKREVHLDIKDFNEISNKNIVKGLCADLRTKFLPEFADITRQCFDLVGDSKDIDEQGVDEFYDWYYHTIVHPLKRLDEKLKGMTGGSAGNRATNEM